MTRWLWGAAALAAAAAVLTAAASATTPGKNGLIAYTKEVSGHFQLFTIRPDGTGERQVAGIKGDAFHADWSPDGKLISFEHERGINGSIALISPDGIGLRDLTAIEPTPQPKKHIYDGQPAFTPDGKWIVFSHGRGPTDDGVWIMRTDGSAAHRLTTNPFDRNWDAGDTDPNVSPNGKFVTFVRIKKADKLQALFIVRIDGSDIKQLTPYGLDVGIKHDWSPDGKVIVLTTYADHPKPGESANAVLLRPNRPGLAPLTHFTGGDKNAYAGSFSPNGKQIVVRLESGSSYTLAVMDRDGANVRRLTTGKVKLSYIDWGSHR